MTRVSAVLGLAILAAGGLVACADDDPPGAFVCEDRGARMEAASAPDRRLIGAASSYPADRMLAAQQQAQREYRLKLAAIVLLIIGGIFYFAWQRSRK